MADYISPTVVQPTIPLTDMTQIEQLLLTNVFESELDREGLYLFAEQYMDNMPVVEIDKVRNALAVSTPGRTADFIRDQLGRLEADAAYLQLDTEIPWETALQGIVRRSATIEHVEVITSFVCSKMRSDGFGGAVTVITADHILGSSIEEMACQLLDRAQYGELGCAPGHGEHALLRLSETHVRRTVEMIFETEAPEGLPLTDVTDDDIREAAFSIAAASDLGHEEGLAAFNAALAAIRIAANRDLVAR
jgi:hypothetical protein